MLTPEQKETIAKVVQIVLQETRSRELPDGEIQFLLHVDGAEGSSWTNIRNNGAKDKGLPEGLGYLHRNLRLE